ncbi:MAG TPA: hypothetical protein VFF16_06845 [Telluria sp.]|nr:hypothetical protein [Telluria sp.]
MQDYQRPPTLHLYGMRGELEAALKEGQFRLVPYQGCLTLSFSEAWDPRLFDLLGPADACLVIHHTEAFGERLHRAVQRTLPNWAGIDGAIAYAGRSPLGATFTKAHADPAERAWMFAWRPLQGSRSLSPVTISLGSIEQYAELRGPDERLS